VLYRVNKRRVLFSQQYTTLYHFVLHFKFCNYLGRLMMYVCTSAFIGYSCRDVYSVWMIDM